MVVRTRNLVRELTANGDEVLVVCPEMGGDPPDRRSPDGRGEAGERVVRCRSFPFPAYPEYRIGLPDAGLAHAVRNFRPDVVHYVNPFAFGFRCHDVLVRGGVDAPVMFSFHTLYGEFVKRYPRPLSYLSAVLWWLMKSYHNLADVNLTVSDVTRRDLTERGFERVRLWPPAVDADLFTPARRSELLRQELGGGPDRPLLLTVSRLAPEKSVDLLADVLDRLPAADVPDARLLVVGDGPERAALEKKFAGRDAVFLGYRKGAELADVYAAADAFVYASRTETMGNVVLEAQASGVPVVAPRAGGLASVVDDGRTGLLYEPGDATAAAAGTARVLLDRPLRRRLISAGLSDTAAMGWADAAARVRADYAAIVESHDPTRVRPRGTVPARTTAASLVAGFRVADALSRVAPSRMKAGRMRADRMRAGQIRRTSPASTTPA